MKTREKIDIIIAPDSFKGSISAQDFCNIAEQAIKSVFPAANLFLIPLADGGEGTVDAFILNTNGRILHKIVTGPLGKKVEAKYGILGDKKTAIIEMASASGLPLLAPYERNPLIATTYGTGELVKAALQNGCSKIILGLGGSATNDGGAGMMQALGFKLTDKNDKPICAGAKGLLTLKHIAKGDKEPLLNQVCVQVACDVNNPLYGPNGAAYVYSPQKGAGEKTVPLLDKALQNYATVIKKDLNKDVANIPGAGAAGGFGAGLIAFLDAELLPGFQIINETIKFENIFKNNKIELVITGEGEINSQTIKGKLPLAVAQTAKKYSVPVIAIVGSVGVGAEQSLNHGIDSLFSIINKPMSLKQAIEQTPKLLFSTVQSVMKLWQCCLL